MANKKGYKLKKICTKGKVIQQPNGMPKQVAGKNNKEKLSDSLGGKAKRGGNPRELILTCPGCKDAFTPEEMHTKHLIHNICPVQNAQGKGKGNGKKK